MDFQPKFRKGAVLVCVSSRSSVNGPLIRCRCYEATDDSHEKDVNGIIDEYVYIDGHIEAFFVNRFLDKSKLTKLQCILYNLKEEIL